MLVRGIVHVTGEPKVDTATYLWYHVNANKQSRGVLCNTTRDSNRTELEGKAPHFMGLRPAACWHWVAFHGGRRFVMNQLELIPMLGKLPEGFGYWFAGLTDGEGHFGINVHTRNIQRRGKQYSTQECDVHFAIALRKDDMNVLSYIQEILKCGKLFPRRYKNPPPYDDSIITWKVMRTTELKYIIVPLFENYPLRTKKTIEFPLWREVVDMRYISIQRRLTHGRPREGHFLSNSEWERAGAIQAEIRKLRRYAKRRNKWGHL